MKNHRHIKEAQYHEEQAYQCARYGLPGFELWHRQMADMHARLARRGQGEAR